MSYLALSDEWDRRIARANRKARLFGYGLLVCCVFGFGIWANAAPITGAIVGSGVFVATGENKTVQHFEGGVIKEIKVREGDHVVPGQSLVVLDDVAPRAELRRFELRQARLEAMEARFQAEMNWQPEINMPEDLVQRRGNDPEIASIIDAQSLTFQARRNTLISEIATLEDGINALKERIGGSRIQLQSVRDQLALIDEELVDKSALLDSGLIRKPELLALRRSKASLQGEIGRLTGEIGDARERIARIREQIEVARNTATKQAVDQLHEVHAELDDVRERVRTARAIVGRVNITAPVAGIVVKLRYHTSGGVIEAGKSVLEIVPVQEEMLIEVPVRPQDIDSVQKGQRATVRLTALSQRVTPMVDGTVIYISADALPNDKSGQQQSGAPDAYVARVRLDRSARDLVRDFTPTPGMPAEVYITTAERTFFEYLTEPVRDSMTRAFREP
ncbi:HlyD family type I secretion periplasmic adaptor subunit [Roseibium salinum]|uniref:Membrane fusion protein (MFP) family protein n=1 Tax=Roseibium salinum TaxID=1604349 RepID=A0ABT3QWK6_9HYPH|nr:HlyD family type I secretion periplasmic adaptor subunit [Roseibium sp. DSM 29163]MCX2721282.1 HlyD family type I secretion periplasmic adaptor subunit [Roseibium sp. DSM 29163]MDN3722148.1 HlyD family type I secretion periplasmic adaptor subunit [Roseibium salinum]